MLSKPDSGKLDMAFGGCELDFGMFEQVVTHAVMVMRILNCQLDNVDVTFVTVQDYKNIEDGLYKLPWDMTTPRNRQYDPLHMLSTVVSFATEASDALRRSMAGTPEKVWLQSSMYPQYYLNTFHYQVMLLLTCHHSHCVLSINKMIDVFSRVCTPAQHCHT